MNTGEHLRDFLGPLGVHLNHAILDILAAFFEYLNDVPGGEPPVPISTNSMADGPGRMPSGSDAVPNGTVNPLPDLPRNERFSTHFICAFMARLMLFD